MKGNVLSFGAHPDDIEIGCGGTEVRLIAQGYEVTHVYLTSGEAGSDTIPRDALAKTREAEARQAGEVIGVRAVEFLRYADGLTQFSREMKIQIIDFIRRIKPEIIFIHATTDQFPDHKVVNELILNAIVGAAGPWYQEATGEPWSARMVLGYEVWHPLANYQLAVDISEIVDVKSRALCRYRSQIESTRYDEACVGLARYRGVMSRAGKYAEVFEVIKTGGFPTAAEL